MIFTKGREGSKEGNSHKNSQKCTKKDQDVEGITDCTDIRKIELGDDEACKDSVGYTNIGRKM